LDQEISMMKQLLVCITAAALLAAAPGCKLEPEVESEELAPGQTDEPIMLQLVEVRVWAADRGAQLGRADRDETILAAAAAGQGSTRATAPKVVNDRRVIAPVSQIIEVTDGQRIAGETRIALPRSARSRLGAWDPGDVTMRVCMARDGMPVNVAIVHGSGFAGADDRVKDAIMKTWRYQPYRARGEPVPVCQRITFRYELHHPDSKPVLF
jgi:outer membrane biosynthesis protein TonB